MAERTATIGGQELELLRWIEARGSASVGAAAEGFGGVRALARSTVLTMMERLRRNGHLVRRAEGGIYRYRVAVAAGEAVRRTVGLGKGYLTNAWFRLRHPDYDELRRLMDAIGATLQVRATAARVPPRRARATSKPRLRTS